jgi:cytochrome c oxidase subunit III
MDLNEEQGARLGTTDVIARADTLPSLVDSHHSPTWWGMMSLITIEVAVFSSLLTSYYYLRAGSPRWPPDGISPPDLLLPSINALVLFASALPVYWATQRIRKGDQLGMKIGMGIALLMGFLFLGLKVLEYRDQDYTWYTNAYGSIVWLITGFHAAHVVAVLLKGIAIWTLSWTGFFNERRHVAIESNSLYWYFVVIVWIPLFFTLYLAPYLL